jgi:hypothetical protein
MSVRRAARSRPSRKKTSRRQSRDSDDDPSIRPDVRISSSRSWHGSLGRSYTAPMSALGRCASTLPRWRPADLAMCTLSATSLKRPRFDTTGTDTSYGLFSVNGSLRSIGSEPNVWLGGSASSHELPALDAVVRSPSATATSGRIFARTGRSASADVALSVMPWATSPTTRSRKARNRRRADGRRRD